jgi:thiamine-phosphate pyrophosphorylase
VLERALAAGVKAIQLRERDLTARELLTLAERLKIMTDQAGATLLINDRVDVSLMVGAGGVHLRADHLPIPVVRRLLGPKPLIGISCHRVDEVLQAEKEGADFIVLGPVYETPSKRVFGAPIGVETLRDAKACSSIPIFAIGGIRPDRIPEVLQAGAVGVGVISAILEAPDVEEETRHLLEGLRSHQAKPALTIDPKQFR